MKMAKASEADIAMAMDVGNYLDAIDRGHVPDAVSVDEESIEWLDEDDGEQCARIIRGLREILGRGSICRVIWGMAVVCDPQNKCIDPDAHTIEVHPDHVKAAEQRDELLVALERVLAEAVEDNEGAPGTCALLQARAAIASAKGGAA